MAHLEDEFGDVISKARYGHGLTANNLAGTCGFTEWSISEIEGYRLTPEENCIIGLAEALGLDSAKLMDTAKGNWSPAPTPFDLDDLHIERVDVGHGPYRSNCYIAVSVLDKAAAIIDPGGSPETIIHYLRINNIVPLYIMVTHFHSDHAGAVKDVSSAFPYATLVCHGSEREYMEKRAEANLWEAKDGDKLPLGRLAIRTLETPGHTEGSVCYLIGRACFTGDSLFAGSVGRAVSQAAYKPMLAAIREKILSLDPDTVLFPGHGPSTTAREELEHNPFF